MVPCLQEFLETTNPKIVLAEQCFNVSLSVSQLHREKKKDGWLRRETSWSGEA